LQLMRNETVFDESHDQDKVMRCKNV
jgi:hypothetical protein